MNQPLFSPRVHDLRKEILKTFEIAEEEAHRLAEELLPIVQKRATTDDPSALDWTFRLKQELAQKLPWRSKSEREGFRLDLSLAKPQLSPTPDSLTDLVRRGDTTAINQAVKQIIMTRQASVADIEALQLFAASLKEQLDTSYENRKFDLPLFEALLALTTIGDGADKFLLNLLAIHPRINTSTC